MRGMRRIAGGVVILLSGVQAAFTAPSLGIARAGVLGVDPADDEDVVSKGDLEEGVEIKVTLDVRRMSDLATAMGLTDERANRRDIWFYDTSKLALFESGLVLRARVKGAEKADATVKARPVEKGRVDASWFSLPGFKCEEDRVGERRVHSCSLTEDQQGDAVRRAAIGEPRVRSLFSKEQERFFEAFGGGTVGWDPLVPLGPIPSRAWKVRTRLFEEPLVVEAWKLDGEDAVLELSTRSESDHADAVSATLTSYLAGLGFEAQPLQDAKTRAALTRLARPN
jgi:hypothetical protein